MQIRHRTIKCTECKFYTFSRRNSETSDTSHAFLPLTVAKLSILKTVQFFGPPCSSSHSTEANYSRENVDITLQENYTNFAWTEKSPPYFCDKTFSPRLIRWYQLIQAPVHIETDRQTQTNRQTYTGT